MYQPHSFRRLQEFVAPRTGVLIVAGAMTGVIIFGALLLSLEASAYRSAGSAATTQDVGPVAGKAAGIGLAGLIAELRRVSRDAETRRIAPNVQDFGYLCLRRRAAPDVGTLAGQPRRRYLPPPASRAKRRHACRLA